MKMLLITINYHLHAIQSLSDSIARRQQQLKDGRDEEYCLQQIAADQLLIQEHQQRLDAAGEPTDESRALLLLLFQ